MNNLNIIHEDLQYKYNRLKLEWQKTCEEWDDSVRDRIEREIWQEFEGTVPQALDELQKLSELIAEAYRETN